MLSPLNNKSMATTPKEDRYLTLTARRHRNMNATLLRQHRHYNFDTSSPKLPSRCRSACSPTYGVSQYNSKSSSSSSHREWATGHVHSGISTDGCTDLHIIWNGALTGSRYRDEIFRPIVVPYVAAIADVFILMDDNCSSHRSNLMNDFLLEEGIIRTEWSGFSPSMNPIEHVWSILGRRVAGRLPLPQTLQGQERVLLEEWDRIPQLLINSLIDSMPQRCSMLLVIRGHHTPY